MMEKLYTVEEVAELASVTGRTIRNYLKSGRLVGRKIGGQWRFPETEVQRLLTGGDPESDLRQEEAEQYVEEVPVAEEAPYSAPPMASPAPPPAYAVPAPPTHIAAAPPSESHEPPEENWDRSWDRDVVYLPDRRATQRASGTTRATDNNNPYPAPAPLPTSTSQQQPRQFDAPPERDRLPQQPNSELPHHAYAPVPPAVPPYSGMEQPRHPAEPYRESAPIDPPYTGPTSFGMPIIAPVSSPAAPPLVQAPVSEAAQFSMPQSPLPHVGASPAPMQGANEAPVNTASVSVTGAPGAFPGVVIPYGYQLVPMQALPPAYYAAMPTQLAKSSLLGVPQAVEPSVQPAPHAPAPPLPKDEPEVPISALSDVAKRVMRFASEVHDCTVGPQVCTIIDMQQSLESAKITSERLSGIARQESEHGLPCQCFVEYDERYFVARYTLFGTSLFLSRCLKLIG